MKGSKFLTGLRDGLPIAFGYLSVAFAFGIFCVGSGLSAGEALLISMTNVTSAGQLAGVPIIASGGTLLEMALAQFVINLRYALMSVSLAQKLDGEVTLPHRLLISFVNTDEVYAVAVSRQGSLKKAYMYGLILTPWLGWSAGTILGAVAGDLLPKSVVAALGIAIYGMFIAILVPKCRQDAAVFFCVLLSAGLSCLFFFLPALSAVPQGFVVILCAVFSAALLAAIRPVAAPGKEDGNV